MPPVTRTSFVLPAANRLTAKEAATLVPSRVSKYAGIINELKLLKPGAAVSYSFGKDVNVKKLINSVTSAIINAGVKPPKGFSFYKAVGKNNELVISVSPSRNRAAK